MSRLVTLQRQFFEQLGLTLMKYKFSPHRASQEFHRKSQYGWESIHVAFIMHHPVDFDVTVDLAVRIDAVEELTYEENALDPKDRKSQTATLGIELGNLTEGKQRRWHIAESNDIPPAVVSIESELDKTILPYFNKYSNLEEVFKLISSHEPWATIHSPFHDKRCKSALALAFIMKKHELLEMIIKNSESFLSSRMEEVEPSFRSQWEHQLKSFQRFAIKIRGLMSA